MITTQKGYLYGGTKPDQKKPEKLIAKVQKQNLKASKFKIPRKFEYRSFCVEGVRIETLERINETSSKALILLHGGAFLRGCDDFYRSHMLFLAKNLSVKVFMPDYSLMPNNAYPTQIEEIGIVWDYVTQTFNPSDVCIVGVGSGANLALNLTETLSKQKMILPVAQVLIAPWIDMTASGDSYYDKFYLDKTKGNFVVSGPDLPTEIKKTTPYLYAKDVSAKNPNVSPLFGCLYGLPPTFICVGDYSILQSDGESLHKALKEANVESEYECMDGQIGEYVLFYQTNRKAKKSIKKMLDWLRNWLKDNSAVNESTADNQDDETLATDNQNVENVKEGSQSDNNSDANG